MRAGAATILMKVTHLRGLWNGAVDDLIQFGVKVFGEELRYERAERRGLL